MACQPLAVLADKVYYTEISGGSLWPTDFIRIAPFNGGAGGADIATLPNPRGTTGVQDLAIANGGSQLADRTPLKQTQARSFVGIVRNRNIVDLDFKNIIARGGDELTRALKRLNRREETLAVQHRIAAPAFAWQKR